MHSFLKTIGFSQITQQAQEEQLVFTAVSRADSCEKFEKEDGTKLVEYTLAVSESCRVRVLGEEDEKGNFHFGYYFPFFKATRVNTEDDIYVHKKVENNAYSGMCDDMRVGISMIFYVQNIIDYFARFHGEKHISDMGVRFAAMAINGKILLPTVSRISEEEKRNKDSNKKQLFAEAKKGDPEAIESLTMQDIDRYAMVSQRIKKEDIFSIVDTSLVPYGSESDMYNILGNIIEVKKEENILTHESIYILRLVTNDIEVDVCVNANDLIGEPEVGRRFRGSIWLQGELEYVYGSSEDAKE